MLIGSPKIFHIIALFSGTVFQPKEKRALEIPKPLIFHTTNFKSNYSYIYSSQREAG
jgi:hypothetical protein